MSLKKNLLANYLGQGWTALMGIAFVPLYIKYLGVESYGLIGLFTVMQGWLALFDMGMTPTINREMARFGAGAHTVQSIRNLLRSLEIVCLFIALLIAVSMWAGSGWLANDWLKGDKLSTTVIAQALSILSLVVALRFIESLYHGALFGLQHQVWYSIISAILATARSAGAVVLLVWVEPSIQMFFIWQAFFSMFTVIVYASKVHRTLPPSPDSPRFSREAIAGIWKFAGGMTGIALLAVLLTQIDKVLLSRLLTLEYFGYYTLAATVTSVLYMIIVPIDNAIYPRMVNYVTQNDMDGLVKLYHQGAQLITALTVPPMLLLVYFSGGVIFMWSGNLELSANTAPILSVLSLGTFLNGLMHMPYQLQIAHGRTQLTIKTNLFAFIILVPAIFLIVPYYGAVGAAWVWVALNSGYVLISIYFMHQQFIPNEKWRWYYADIFIPTVGAIGVVLLAQQFQPVNYQNRLHWFFFLLITGMLVMLISMLSASTIRERIKLYAKI